MQWRVRRAPLHRRVFSAASVGLSYGAASVTFHGLDRLFLPVRAWRATRSCTPRYGPCW